MKRYKNRRSRYAPQNWGQSPGLGVLPNRETVSGKLEGPAPNWDPTPISLKPPAHGKKGPGPNGTVSARYSGTLVPFILQPMHPAHTVFHRRQVHRVKRAQ